MSSYDIFLAFLTIFDYDISPTIAPYSSIYIYISIFYVQQAPQLQNIPKCLKRYTTPPEPSQSISTSEVLAAPHPGTSCG